MAKMGAKLVWVAVGIAVAIALYLAISPPAPAGPCNNGVCKVSVTVSDCTKQDGFTAAPDDLRVGGPNRIEWTLATSGYKFTASGIVIKNNDGVFVNPELQAQGKKFQWKDRYKEPGTNFPKKTYPYSINVESEEGKACGSFDPTISND